ncbi:lymphatic vessel endothelial hyaluronic acid receptor 1a [Danio aesculapii]|uniref:lymphatic vessel endothelial hyaluronic acid receptor 1a n=1 Tax=Danio aesculapii TaxID=1142201 RepID=UPI0024BF4134|nr:lymphatic vessel endothelial hyaluronic acid receptor 1a [Danio aesculapii]
MTRVWMRMMMKMVLFSSMFMSALTFDMQLVKVHPKQAISGVSEASIGNQYALNASSARDLCEQLGLTIANKAQLAEAQKHGLETCRFGWIDEQIAVVPRVHANPNCGIGRTGVVVWRAIPSKRFDVFCFNVTDFETQASIKAHRMTTRKPMTTRSSVAPTAGIHLRGSPFPTIPSHWSSVPPSASAGPSVVHRADDAKHLALSSGSTEAVPAALLITVTFAVMIAVFLALYYVRMKRPCKARCDVEQQKEYIETEVWEHRTKEDLQKTQEEQMEEIQREQMEEKNQEELEEKHQEEQIEEKNQEELEEKHQEEQIEERNQEEQIEERNQEEQVEENDSCSAEQH